MNTRIIIISFFDAMNASYIHIKAYFEVYTALKAEPQIIFHFF